MPRVKRAVNARKKRKSLLSQAKGSWGGRKNLIGQARMTVKCQDGETRMCRVRGKMKKRRWVREGDIVLVSPWEIQADERGDIVFRYTRNQAEWLQRKGLLDFE